jgi:hypothetical protein
VLWGFTLLSPGNRRQELQTPKEEPQASLSLQFKKVGEMWSARVGQAHRALAVEDGTGFIWVWVGSHDDYEKMIKGR